MKKRFMLKAFLVALTLFSANFIANAQAPDFSLVGFASINGGTTGGAGGEVYYASNYAQAGYNEPGEYIYQLLRGHRNTQQDNPNAGIIIYVDETIHENTFGRSKMDLKDISNVSIFGVEDNGRFTGVGWTVSRANNVIFRNLTIHHVSQGEGTGIELTENSHNIWIDRNTFYSYGPDTFDDKDYYDGLVDIKRGVQYVTVSWNVFRDSWKASLLGHTDNESLAASYITYHHNLYQNVNSRTPLIRYATVHTFNNYFLDIGSSAINCRVGAQVRVENNYFENVGSGEPDNNTGYVQGPVGWWYGSPSQGYWETIGNIVVNSPDDHMESNTTVNIPYSYANVLHNASDVPSVVLAHAGATGSTPDDSGDTGGGDTGDTYSLSTSVSGEGSVSVSPSGGPYTQGTTVTVTANPASGWSFSSWSGDLSESTNPETIVMNSNRSVVANFTQDNGDGGETVTALEWNISQSPFPNYQGNIESNTTIEGLSLYATSSNEIQINQHTGFNPYTYRLELRGGGSFSNSTTPASRVLSFDVPGDAEIEIKAVSSGADARTLNVAAGNSGNIIGTVNAPSGTLNTETVSYSGSGETIFIWSAGSGINIYHITVSTESDDGGDETGEYYTLSVNTTGNGSVERTPSSSSYLESSEVELRAVSASGWQFSSWSGDLSSSTNPATVTMDGNKSITALFTQSDDDIPEETEVNGTVMTNTNFNSDHHYVLVNKESSMVLSVNDNSIENEEKLIQRPFEGIVHQMWRFDNKGGSNFYVLNKRSDKVMLPQSRSRNEGEIIYQDRDGSSQAQEWIITHIEDGYFSLVNNNSSLAMESLSSSQNADIIQNPYTGSDKQLWRIVSVEVEQEEPDFSIQGFATAGFNVTGGEGGEIVTVTTAAELTDYIQRSQPYIILVDGTIEMPEGDAHSPSDRMWNVAPNKTIFGLETAHITGGGFNIRGTRNNGVGEVTPTNIIIRNLKFSNAADDCINIEEGASHVWIDHNEFFDSYDGLVDIKREASYITVSWNIFHTHDKTCLLGHDDSHTHDRGFLKVTYHHNWYYDIQQRLPRARYAQAHLYNNYFENIGGYVFGPGVEAEIISEHNHIVNANRAMRFYDSQSQPGYLSDRNSIFEIIDHDLELKPEGISWSPSDYYEYTLNNTLNVKHLVTTYAGTGVLSYDNNDHLTSINEEVIGEFEVLTAYPNPFNPVTNVQFRLPETSKVNIQLINVRGQIVANHTKNLSRGLHTHIVDGNNMPSGVYFLRVTSGKHVKNQKLLLIK